MSYPVYTTQFGSSLNRDDRGVPRPRPILPILPLPDWEIQLAESNLTELVMRITDKDEAASKALYALRVSRVYGLAIRITRQRAAAEEVVEEVYIQVWDQAERFDAQRGNVFAWLMIICRSRAIDHLRRCDITERHLVPERLADESVTVDDNPQDLLLAVERNSRVHGALERLCAVQRQLLALAFFKGLSHQTHRHAARYGQGTFA